MKSNVFKLLVKSIFSAAILSTVNYSFIYGMEDNKETYQLTEKQRQIIGEWNAERRDYLSWHKYDEVGTIINMETSEGLENNKKAFASKSEFIKAGLGFCGQCGYIMSRPENRKASTLNTTSHQWRIAWHEKYDNIDEAKQTIKTAIICQNCGYYNISLTDNYSGEENGLNIILYANDEYKLNRPLK